MQEGGENLCEMAYWLHTVGNYPLCQRMGKMFHQPLVLEGGDFFVSEGISPRLCRMGIHYPQRVVKFPRLCRTVKMSEGGELSPPSVSANHRVAYKKFG